MACTETVGWRVMDFDGKREFRHLRPSRFEGPLVCDTLPSEPPSR